MSHELKSNSLVISASNESAADSIERAASETFGKLAAAVKESNTQKQSASNEGSIAILKQAIERTQANVSETNWIIRHTKEALAQAETHLRTLTMQEEKEIRSLWLVAKASGFTDQQMHELAHEMNADCEQEDCQDCCGEFHGHEHDPDEGFMCLNCGHEGYEDACGNAYDRREDRD